MKRLLLLLLLGGCGVSPTCPPENPCLRCDVPYAVTTARPGRDGGLEMRTTFRHNCRCEPTVLDGR